MLPAHLYPIKPQNPPLPPGLSLYLCDLSTLPWDLDHCHSLLPPEPLSPRPPLRPIAHLRRLQTRALLYQLVGQQLGVPPQQLTPAHGPDGKPTLPGLAFNSSHSGDWALLALAPQGRLGVDLEIVRNRDNLHNITNACMTYREQLLWDKLTNREDIVAFYRIWTAKEAALKAWGLGIDALRRVELNDLQQPTQAVLDQEHACKVWMLQPSPALVAAVAVA